jgi:hypothetical protein
MDTRSSSVLLWASAQVGLGAALERIGERESGTERLEQAIVAYREALKEWTRDRVPFQWASAQNDLGGALETLGERENRTEELVCSRTSSL